VKLTSVEAIIAALAAKEVLYLVAGGLAVNAHGFLRYTKDVDLVASLDRENVLRTFAALETIGFRPAVPVTAAQFADPAQRESWIHDKGMRVLQFWSDLHRETPVDLFVEEPFPFEEEDARAVLRSLPGAGDVRFVSLPTLIRMKEAVGRPQDLMDVENLRLRLPT